MHYSILDVNLGHGTKFSFSDLVFGRFFIQETGALNFEQLNVAQNCLAFYHFSSVLVLGELDNALYGRLTLQFFFESESRIAFSM